jgi:hypothetical protein
VPAPKARGRRGSAVHRGLVGARTLVGTPYLADAELRSEYARDIAPRTEAALARVLDEVWGAVGVGLPMRAIDLGSGTGAVGRVLRARCGETLELIAVDQTPGPGVVRANLAVEFPAVEGKFDLVVAAHLLNELFVQRADRVSLRAQRVLAWSRALLAPGGLLILVEPALRETSTSSPLASGPVPVQRSRATAIGVTTPPRFRLSRAWTSVTWSSPASPSRAGLSTAS